MGRLAGSWYAETGWSGFWRMQARSAAATTSGNAENG